MCVSKKERLKVVIRKLMPNTFFKQFILNRNAKSLKNIKFLKNKQDVIVLGNGPSLKDNLEKIPMIAE